MREVIDEKVVEMRFDNAQFERETKHTLSSLTKLKAALKFSGGAKALEDINNVSKKISLKNIELGVTSLANRFSFLGRTVMKITDNIRDALVGKVGSAVNFVTDSIVSGGLKRAMNIENAHFQLQALLKDETKVQEIMSDAMDSVDGTAYAYDEAAKAASQFAASGIKAGKDMRNALRGITGVAAMTNSSFEDISRIFTTVAGNGRLMGDQLLQLSSRGLNAASIISDYYKKVKGISNMTEAEVRSMVTAGKISFKEFSDAMTWAFGDSAKRANETLTGSFSNTKAALARIGAGFFSPFVEQNGELVRLFNVLIKKTNSVKSALVFDEQRSAIEGLTKATGLSKDNISELFDIIKNDGYLSIGNLNKLNKTGINATKTLTKYMKGVKDGSIRSSYAIKTLIDNLSKDGEITSKKVEKWVKKGKIDLSTFTSAMEKEYGKEKTLSKRFVDFFQDKISSLSKAIDKADLTVPIKLLEKTISITSNSFRGFYNILKPIIKALKDALPAFDSSKVLKFADVIEKLTSKLKLSKKQNQELYDTFKGIFDILRMLITTIGKLLGIISPMSTPVQDLGNSFLNLTGAIGRSLSAFSKWIDQNPIINSTLKLVGSGVQSIFKVLSKLFNLISESNTNIKLNELKLSFLNFIPDKAINGINFLIKKFKELASSIFNLKLDSNIPLLKGFGNVIEKIKNIITSKDGLSTFITNLKEYVKGLKEGTLSLFDFDKAVLGSSNRTKWFSEIIQEVFGIFKDFRNFIINKLRPALEKVDLSNLFALGGGTLIVVSISKIIKIFDNLSKIGNMKGLKTFISIFPNLNNSLRSFSKVMNAVSTSIHAESIYKIAKAIGILAGSILLLSFADIDKVKTIGTILVALTASLLLGWAAVTAASAYFEKSKDNNPINKISNFIGSLIKEVQLLVKRLNTLATIKVITSSLKTVANAIMIIVASLAAIWYLYKNDVDALNKSIIIVGAIGAVMVGLIVMFNRISKNPIQTANISNIMKSVIFVSAALAIMVTSMSKLFKMEIPSDWGLKLVILAGLIVGISGLIIAISAAARIAKGGALKGVVIPVIAVSGLLLTLVKSISILFKIDLPNNWALRLGILSGMIYGVMKIVTILTVLSLLSGKTSTLSKNIKSLALLLISSTLSLSILFKMNIPEDWEDRLKILKSVYNSLIGLIVIMGVVSRLGGGTFKAGGTIAALALVILTTTMSLYALSLLPFDKLLKGAISLGVVLLALGGALAGAGQIITPETFKSVLAMALTIGSITIALAVLSTISVPDLAKSGIALASMLMALAIDFVAISKMTNQKVWANILLMAVNIAVISGSLYFLSSHPWDQMLAGASGLALVLLAASAAMAIMDSIPVSPTAIISYLGAIIVTLSVAIALEGLAKYPYKDMLAAATSLSLVLVAVTECIAILGNIPVYAGAIAAANLIEFVGILALALWRFGDLMMDDDLRLAVEIGIKMLQVMAEEIGTAISMFIEGMLSSLPKIGTLFAEFGENIKPLIEAVNMLDESSARGTLYLAAMFAALTAADILSGFSRLISFGQGGLPGIGKQLAKFGPQLRIFANSVDGVKEESVKGAAAATMAMVKVAKAVPGFMGLEQFMFGHKSLSEFGMQLVLFAPLMKTFSTIVKDIKEESVRGAAAAAMSMTAVANNLPNLNGLTQLFFGRKSLSDFGKELVLFAPLIAAFAEIVKDIDGDSVNGARSAAMSMLELANNLPKDKNFFENLFGGGKTTITKFGSQLVSFAISMKSFSDELGKVDYSRIHDAIQNIKELIDLNNSISSDSTKNLIKFVESLDQIPEDCIDKFCDTFENATDKVNASINSFSNNVHNGLKMALAILSPKFYSGGTSLVNKFNDGLIKASQKAITKTKQSGLYVVDGFIKGTTDPNRLKKLSNSGLNCAKVIDSAFRNYMGINSPSKLTIEEGIYTLMGWEEGLSNKNGLSSIQEVSTNVAENGVINPYRKEIMSKTDQVRADTWDFQNAAILEPQEECADLAYYNSSLIANNSVNGFINISALRQGEAYEAGKSLNDAFLKGATNAKQEIYEATSNPFYKYIKQGEEATKKTEAWAKYQQKLNKETAKKESDEIDKNINQKWIDLGEGKNLSDWERLERDMKLGKDTYDFGYDIGDDWSSGVSDGISSGGGGVSDSANKVSTKANKNAEKNTKKLEKAIKTNLKGAHKAIKDNAENLIKEDDKFWLKLLKQHQKGADKEKYKDMSLKEFKKETLNDISELYNNYSEKYESTVKNILSTTNLFASKTKESFDSIRTSIDILSEISSGEVVDKDTIIGNISVTKDMADEYVEIMNSLSSRIEGTELYEYLRKMGYKNVDQLRIFNEMTESELEYYVDQYKKLGDSISNASIFEADREPVVDIVQNLKDDLEAKEEYIKLQKELREKFKGTDFLEYVKDINIDGLENLRMINSLNEQETLEMLKTYNENLEASRRIAEIQLDEDLDALEKDISDKLSLKNIDIDLETFKKNWNGSTKDLIKFINQTVIPLETALDSINPKTLWGISGNKLTKELGGILKNTVNLLKPVHIASEKEGKKTSNSYSKGINSNNEIIKTSSEEMVKSVINTISEKLSEFNKSGEDTIKKYSNGIKNSKSNVINMVMAISSEMKKILNKPNEYYSIGNGIIGSLNLGLTSMIPTIQGTITSISDLINGLMSKIASAVSLSASLTSSYGTNVINGYSNGISNNLKSVKQAATAIATTTLSSIKSVLKIHSPSKATEELADYTGMGFIKTLWNYVKEAGEAGEAIAGSTYSGLSRVVTDDFITPTIKPNVDMSEVDSAIERMRNRFNKIIIGTTLDAEDVGSTINRTKETKIISEDKKTKEETKDVNITYNQYNNSPKALSRFDIYRQTQNQLNQFRNKGVKI